jgi:hypothetical protein
MEMGGTAMGEVDPATQDKKIFLVRHHRYDPETNHFRWIALKAFDTEEEMNELLESLWRDLEARRFTGNAHPKEQFAGEARDPQPRERNGSGVIDK